MEKLSDEELQAKVEELNKKQEDQGKLLQTKHYPVKFETQNNLNLIKKWLSKEVEWDHQSVPTLIAMYDGLKRAIEVGVDEDGNAHLNSLVVGQ